MGPDSGPCGGQVHVQWWLWAHKVLKEPACLFVGPGWLLGMKHPSMGVYSLVSRDRAGS